LLCTKVAVLILYGGTTSVSVCATAVVTIKSTAIFEKKLLNIKEVFAEW